MGNYVEGALLPGEAVVANAKPHWAMFLAPAIIITIGVLAGKAGTIIIVIGAVWAAFRFMVYQTTELALTNKRVIAKSGIIRRQVIDVSLTKVEGISYNQGIVGRIFGYGSVLVRGTGVGQVPVRFIERPENFKHEVGRLLHT